MPYFDSDSDCVSDPLLGSKQAFRVQAVPSLSTDDSSISEKMKTTRQESEEREEERECGRGCQETHQLLQAKIIAIKPIKFKGNKGGLETLEGAVRKAATPVVGSSA